MTKPPTCPACGSTDLRIEDAATGRHQCRRCLWRCILAADGSTRDWLKIGSVGKSTGGKGVKR